ncbi:MAG: ABC transporter permease, partial [Planctomycetes bacterium]|nr:ABC transporter permease [Planctomycetota bacterium]
MTADRQTSGPGRKILLLLGGGGQAAVVADAARLGKFKPSKAYGDAVDRAMPALRAAGRELHAASSPGHADAAYVAEMAAARPLPAPGNEDSVWFRRVTPSYFETLGLQVVAGRQFNSSDDHNGPRTVMINQTLADRYFPGVNAVGQRLNVNNPQEP